jgi:transposase, IS5 family
MQQLSFAAAEFAAKTTRRERLLAQMELVVPWSRLLEALGPFDYPDRRGRPPIGLERMRRMDVVPPWYGLADEALDDAVYDSQALRHGIGIELGSEGVPDATTRLTVRRLLEAHALSAVILTTINAELSARSLLLKEGTLVDATILHAPASTKHRAKARDAAMHSTRKGNQWYFGMKAHIGADADSGLVHTVVGTAAHVADVTQTSALLHGKEKTVDADAGYLGAEKREELAKNPLTWRIAMKRRQVKAIADAEFKALTERCERLKAQVRARVEHPVHILKNRFGYRKVRDKGLEKNTAQVRTRFALVNLVIAKNALQAAP